MRRYGLPALTLVAMLSLAAPAVAGSVHFHTQFDNDTAVVLKAVILHSAGDPQKSENVRPGKKEKFHFGLKCKEEHTRKFEVYENQHGTLIGSGSFAMETGRQIDIDNDCTIKRFDLTCDPDPDANDDFKLTCSKVAEDLVRIRIEKP
jgi:hypothetical protein